MRSDSSAYSKETFTRGVRAETTVIGIPIGPPSQSPEPKSAWRCLSEPIEATIAAEPGATGSVSMRRFQKLSAGKTGQARPGGVAGGDEHACGEGGETRHWDNLLPHRLPPPT